MKAQFGTVRQFYIIGAQKYLLNDYLVPRYFFFLILFYYLLLAALGLRCCARAFSSCGEQGLLFVAVRGLLTVVASLVAEYRLSSCGARAQLLHGMWDLPGPGLEPMSPALAGGFLTTAPPGKPSTQVLLIEDN